MQVENAIRPYKSQSTFKAHGVCVLSNTMVLEIELSSSGDAARLRPNYETKVATPKWQEIKYDRNGDAYVTWYGTRYELSKFIRL